MEPFATKMRPASLETFVGQSHLVGPNKPLRRAIETGHIFSFILWGPPGVGKTTLARIYAKSIGAQFYELSAVSAGKEDIKKIIPSQQQLFGGVGTIVFIDEIHRFSKAQQDFLLPYVESGQLFLIGATTENPSFEVIPALLSRCQVFTLEQLTPQDMATIVARTDIPLEQAAIDWLIAMANGDARQLLSLLERTVQLYGSVTIDHLKNAFQNNQLRYDKKGEEHYNTISAFIKSLRASQVDAALYYLARMVQAGEDPLFIARRMVIFASEDIGIADAHALTIANDVFRAVETIGYPECGINLAHGVCYLAQAPKNRAAYEAYMAALEDVKKTGNLPIPLLIRNAPTSLMKEWGYGKGYEKYTTQNLLPTALKNKKYFEPQ
jgi:putative ATPase